MGFFANTEIGRGIGAVVISAIIVLAVIFPVILMDIFSKLIGF